MEPHGSLDKTNSAPNLSIVDDDTPEKTCGFITSRAKRQRIDDEKNVGDYSGFRQEMHELFENWSLRQDCQMRKQEAQITKLFPILKGIQEANSNIETTITFLAEQNAELKKDVERLQGEIKKKDKYVAILEDRLEDTLRTSRKTTVEIKNVTCDTNESKDCLVGMIENLSKTINVTVNRGDIRDIYKSKSTTEKKSVIVELSSTLLKEDILKGAKSFNKRNHSDKLCAKHLGNKRNPDSPIFIAEYLTPKASRLFFLARDLKRSRNYKYCWTSYGRVYVRKDDNSPIILITNEAILQTLMNK